MQSLLGKNDLLPLWLFGCFIINIVMLLRSQQKIGIKALPFNTFMPFLGFKLKV
jgi:hypothetical protein